MSNLNETYTRLCQECGHRQETRDPATYSNDKWRDLQCKRCHSSSLDFGSDAFYYDLSTKSFKRVQEDE